jgi:predicted lipoprotein with Yx(FWY)xxD motif
MNRTRAISFSALLTLLASAILVFAAGGSAAKARVSATTLGVRQTPLGRILVGTGGRTLYLFLADRPNVSRLSRAGFAAWPAFVANGSPQASGGVNRSKITTIASRGAKRQLSYAGHPLYYFVGDQHAGSTAGEGLFEFGARWYVVSPAGKAITSSAPKPAPSPPMPTSTPTAPSTPMPGSAGPYGY